MAVVGQRLPGRVRYHLRPGPQIVTIFDSEQFLDFADRYL
jgi:hypothetical protein